MLPYYASLGSPHPATQPLLGFKININYILINSLEKKKIVADTAPAPLWEASFAKPFNHIYSNNFFINNTYSLTHDQGVDNDIYINKHIEHRKIRLNCQSQSSKIIYIAAQNRTTRQQTPESAHTGTRKWCSSTNILFLLSSVIFYEVKPGSATMLK